VFAIVALNHGACDAEAEMFSTSESKLSRQCNIQYLLCNQ
jgi:hypothetical protein